MVGKHEDLSSSPQQPHKPWRQEGGWSSPAVTHRRHERFCLKRIKQRMTRYDPRPPPRPPLASTGMNTPIHLHTHTPHRHAHIHTQEVSTSSEEIDVKSHHCEHFPEHSPRHTCIEMYRKYLCEHGSLRHLLFF